MNKQLLWLPAAAFSVALLGQVAFYRFADIPVASNEVSTTPPRPVWSRRRRAASVPASRASAAVWSPSPPRIPGGASPGGTSCEATPVRDRTLDQEHHRRGVFAAD